MLSNRILQAASGATGYKIQRSLRFRSNGSVYLNRTFGTPTDGKKWTMSFWFKRGSIGVTQNILQCGGSLGSLLYFDAADTLRLTLTITAVETRNTTQVFRDTSSWYHLVLVLDTTLATASDRVKMYLNGSQITSFAVSNDPGLNTTFAFNSAASHTFGLSTAQLSGYFDGYISEFYFIDGQALTPSSFGQTLTTTNQWVAKKYTGTYGANGFYLPFSDNSAIPNLGYDKSSGSYSDNLRLLGTNIGGMTGQGGLAMAFDGVNGTQLANAAVTPSQVAGYVTTNSVGKDWGVGTTKTITAFRIWSPTDEGFRGDQVAVGFKLQGSTDNFSTSVVDLYAGTTPAGINQVVTVTSGITTTTAYRYHRIVINGDGVSNCRLGEVELFEVGSYGINNWYPNNISLTSGATYDSMLDVPAGNAWADGGNGRGNYATLNPVFKNAQATFGVMASLSAGNLDSVMAAGTNVYSTIDIPTGVKIYVECFVESITNQLSLGFIADDGNINRSALWNNAGGIDVDNVNKFSAVTSTGIIGVAVDRVSNTVQFYRDGSALGTAYTISTSGFSSYLFWAYTNSGATIHWNFGQRPFTYTPPTGFKALHTGNLSIPTIRKSNQHFDILSYAGDGTSSRTISGLGFQPDFLWNKSRSLRSHTLWDSVRGVGVSKELSTNLTDAEGGANILTSTYGYINTITQSGFSIAAGSTNSSAVNANGESFVTWSWKAGGTAVSNTAGTITSQVSANSTAGFSVVTYTGTGVAATIGHGLGVVPSLIIGKPRNTAASWCVYHTSVGATAMLRLESTIAQLTRNTFNNTAPTSSVFSVGVAGPDLEGSGINYVAYVFAEVPGFSKFSSYTGNGAADGTFVYCGFRPKYVLIKRSDAGTEPWIIYDGVRNQFNLTNLMLYPNLSNAETTGVNDVIDLTSSGFKLRGTGSSVNVSGGTFIFMAFAESPFKYANAR